MWLNCLHLIGLLTLLQCYFVKCLNDGGLKITRLDVPSPVAVGESLELTCDFSLGKDKLYSVKWYKDGYEFFRYVPKDWPPAQAITLKGISVDISRSGINKVYLNYLDLENAGTYRCEISTEAPTFNTAAAEKDLQVYSLPSEGPTVVAQSDRVAPGEMVRVNCTSAKSKPPAKLYWNINGVPFEKIPGAKSEYSTRVMQSDRLQISYLGLRFRARKADYDHGFMRLTCTSHLEGFYSEPFEARILITDPTYAPTQLQSSHTISPTKDAHTGGVNSGQRSSLLLLSFTIIALVQFT